MEVEDLTEVGNGCISFQGPRKSDQIHDKSGLLNGPVNGLPNGLLSDIFNGLRVVRARNSKTSSVGPGPVQCIRLVALLYGYNPETTFVCSSYIPQRVKSRGRCFNRHFLLLPSLLPLKKSHKNRKPVVLQKSTAQPAGIPCRGCLTQENCTKKRFATNMLRPCFQIRG